MRTAGFSVSGFILRPLLPIKRLIQQIMPLRLLLLPIVMTLGAIAAGPASAACKTTGYTYAGIEGWDSSSGVAATLTVAERPTVAAGHVAAWIGIGGFGAGAGGADIWLQAGLSARPGRAPHVYYELVQPGVPRRYTEIGAAVRVGQERRVALVEIARRPTWWRVWVDGRPVTAPLHLPGKTSWEPTATAESWNPGGTACNAYAFRFGQLQMASARGGPWRDWSHSSTLRDGGAAVRRYGRTAFLAAAVLQPERNHEAAALTVGR